MTPHITMWSYLWDFVDDGITETLRDMKDNLGLTALSVATHYHTVEHLRPHTRGASIYRADSSLYFIPEEQRWQRSPMLHQVAPLAAPENPLAQLSERAADIGLDLVSWTLCCHSSWLGREYPDCAEQNALGDRYPEALCPANPEVREFLKAMVDDLSHNYKFSLLELESFHYAGTSRHYHHHEKIGFVQTLLDQFLLGVCFCEHCIRRANVIGIDAQSVRAYFIAAIKHTFTTGEPQVGTIQDMLARIPDLAKYVETRVETVNSLLQEMQDIASAPLSPIVWSTPELGGVDGAAIAAITPSITIAAYNTDVEANRKAIRDAIAMTNDVSRIRVGYHVYPPIMPDQATLLQHISAALDMGVCAFSFYHYGIAPRPNLLWVHDATELIRKKL